MKLYRFKGKIMQKRLVFTLFVMVTVMANSLFAQDCEEWVAGQRSYSVGETATVNGQGYVCVNAAGAWENPSMVDSWFWDPTTLCDQSDNSAPTDIFLDNADVNEDQPVGTIVGVLTSADVDAGDNHTYSFATGTGSVDNGSFSIVGSELRINVELNYSLKQSYSVLIRTTDDGGLYFDKQFTITINEVEDFAAWSYSDVLYFNTTSSGADISSPVSEYPVLVKLDNSNFDFTQTKTNGEDIRFEDPDGLSLPYEIELWDATNGKGQIWVKVPQIDASSATDFIKMYWGKSDALSKSSSVDVFGSVNSLIGTWHLNVDYSDATGNYNGINNNSIDALGIIANGQQFNNNASISLSSTLSDLSTTSGTFSCWIYMNAAMVADASNHGIIDVGSSSLADNAIGLFKNVNNKLEMRYKVNGVDYSAVMDDISSFSDQWKFVVGTYDNNNVNLYVDGVLIAQVDRSAGGDITKTQLDQIFIGSDATGGQDQFFNGLIDEVRMSDVTASADWIKLNYENQKNSSSFITFESAQSAIIAPSNFTATTAGNTIVLNWVDNSDNETGFDIYNGADVATLSYVTTVSSGTNTYTHNVGNCDVKSVYAVKAVNQTSSSNMVILSGDAFTIPCIPTGLSAAALSEVEIQVSWNGGSEEYVLEAKESAGATWITIYTGNLKSFNYQGLSCNTSYDFRVKGKNPAGESEYTTSVSSSTNACAILAPSGLTADNSVADQITLSWTNNAVSAITGFKVFRRLVSDPSFTEIALTGDVTTYTDNSVDCNTEYVYYVQAYDAVNVSGASNNINVTTLYCGAGTNSSKMVGISAMALNSDDSPMNGLKTIRAILYSVKGDIGSEVFSETFNDIDVKNGFFQISLGVAPGLVDAISANEKLFYDIIIDGASIFNDEMQVLSSSAYSIKNNFNLHGVGSPVGVVSAPVGASYVDTQNQDLYMKSGDTDSDWIKINQ